MGYCRGELWFGPSSVSLTMYDRDTGVETPRSTGTLTERGVAALDTVQRELLTTRLESTYGCPDCDDGGAAWVELLVAGDLIDTSEYELANPPRVLAGFDVLLRGLTDALRDCVSTSQITVESCTGL